MTWIEDRAHLLTPELIVHSNIYKVMFQIAHQDVAQFPLAHRSLIERARKLYKEWASIIKIEPKVFLASLTQPTASKVLMAEQDYEVDVTGWNFDLSDQLTQEKED